MTVYDALLRGKRARGNADGHPAGSGSLSVGASLSALLSIFSDRESPCSTSQMVMVSPLVRRYRDFIRVG